MKPLRTRFAPSPTGALHSGVVRTATFAMLIAKHTGGQFLLRIEDTDQKREVAGAIANITTSLKWLGLQWDEGPEVGGPYAPYVQSERLDIYKEWAMKLYKEGKAYADPYSPEELQAFRERAQAEKRPFLYRDHRPETPPEWDGTQPLRIRLEPKSYSWDDAVLGTISMGPEMIDDYIIIKSDGFPTYNFCHIIDDHLMEIGLVTRSQEFLSSIPKFLAAHEALGLTPPINATLPPILDESGKRKLSKRFGAKPVIEYKEMGYLPEAMINFLATIGWNDGTEQEVFTLDELIKKFDLSRVQKSGGIFDEKRLMWLNGVHIRQLNIDDLYERSVDFWPAEAEGADEAYKKQVLGLVQERLKFLAELPELTRFFFTDLPVDAELIDGHKQLKKVDKAELKGLLEQAKETLDASDFTDEDLTTRLNDLLETTGQKPAVLFSLIRVATTQSPASPGLAETLRVLGKELSLTRIGQQISSL